MADFKLLCIVADHWSGNPQRKLVISMFMSQYNHTIDAKGRLIIPSKYRDVLGDNFVMTKGLDGCLLVYDNTEWANFEEKLKDLPLAQKEARQFVRFFLAGACKAEVDKQGRFLVPGVLREFAEIGRASCRERV